MFWVILGVKEVYVFLIIPYINYIQIPRYYPDTCQESRYLTGQSLPRSGTGICLAHPPDTDLGTRCATLQPGQSDYSFFETSCWNNSYDGLIILLVILMIL